MADEAIKNPESDKIDSPESTTEEKVETKSPTEGTLDSIAPEEIKEPKKEHKVVPEAVFLELKKELKALKEEIKNSKNSEKSALINAGMSELTNKYPDVSPDFIQDILNSATSEATKKIEEKYNPIIEKQEIEKKEIAFNKAFNDLFDKTLEENPDLPKDIDREVVKALGLTPTYRNIPLADILYKLYGNNIKGKGSSENNVRESADRVEDVTNFDKITPEQKRSILADEKARKKYFDWLDTQPGR